jgi:HlyD family secretion protein
MPIMQLGDLSEMVCIAEVYEADIQELVVNQKVTLRSPAFSGAFANGPVDSKTPQRTGGIEGRVTRIGNLIASPGLANRNPLAPADRSVVEVRIAITDQAAIAHAAKRVGLQVTVEFGSQPRLSGDQ